MIKILALITFSVTAIVATYQCYRAIKRKRLKWELLFYMIIATAAIVSMLSLTNNWWREWVWGLLMLVMASAGSLAGFLKVKFVL